MIGQLKALLRIKELKEEQAFRVVHARRGEVADAVSAIEIAREKTRQNAAALPAREDAIYHRIIGRVVDYDRIEQTKSEMLVLEREHARLVDALERATHVHARLEKELAEAAHAHRKTTKARDKYIVLAEEVSSEFHAKAGERLDNPPDHHRKWCHHVPRLDSGLEPLRRAPGGAHGERPSHGTAGNLDQLSVAGSQWMAFANQSAGSQIPRRS